MAITSLIRYATEATASLPSIVAPCCFMVGFASAAATVQQAVDRCDDLVDRDPIVAVHVAGFAPRQRHCVEGDGDHDDEFIDGDLAVVVAIPDARPGRGRCGRRL